MIYDLLLIIQIYSGITSGKVLNGELYTQRLQKLIYLYFVFCLCGLNLKRMTDCRQNINKLTSVIFVTYCLIFIGSPKLSFNCWKTNAILIATKSMQL